MQWGTVAEWIVGLGTFALGFIAVFQDRLRAWAGSPKLTLYTKTEPPHCCPVRWTNPEGVIIADGISVRLLVKNTGRSFAKNVEVYVDEVSTRTPDGSWISIETFPPMNLLWTDIPRGLYFPGISPGMGKHCSLGHITNPQHRRMIPADENPTLGLSPGQTSFVFDLIAEPNQRSHVVGPGRYKIRLILAAENARPIRYDIELNVTGSWFDDLGTMLRQGVGVKVL